MQIKKDHAKTKIKNSAKKLFFVMKYKDASMRDVAKMSDMTVGNIYRYYENKEILFEDIVGDCYKKVENLIKVTDFAKKFIKNRIGLNEKNVYKNSKFKTHILNLATDVIVQNANELYILLNNSEGSKYENTCEKVTNMVNETILAVVPNMTIDSASIYSNVMISTISYILKNFIGDKQKLKTETMAFIQKYIEVIN